jgi:hypothetical protein
MTRFTPLKMMAVMAALSIASTAMAAPVCTKVPQAKWMAPEQMKAKVAKMGYRNIKAFKVSGSCYEIYAYTKDGKRAEVYFNPVNGAIVQNNVD